MKNRGRSALVTLLAAMLALTATTGEAAQTKGAAEFKEYCAACHANGGNLVKPDKTLSRKDREKHGVKTANDIVKLMRNPGEGMTTFDKQTISDKEAKSIAEYIIKTFK